MLIGPEVVSEDETHCRMYEHSGIWQAAGRRFSFLKTEGFLKTPDFLKTLDLRDAFRA